MKSFGDWMKDLANSIEDTSYIDNSKGKEEVEVRTMEDFRRRAYYAALSQVGAVEETDDICDLFDCYIAQLAGLDLYVEYHNITGWENDYAEKMKKFLANLKKFCGVIQ